MKCQSIFSYKKNRKHVSKCRLLNFLPSKPSVKHCCLLDVKKVIISLPTTQVNRIKPNKAVNLIFALFYAQSDVRLIIVIARAILY